MVIKTFRHKGLREFFGTGNVAKIQAAHAKKLRFQLAALDTAQTIEDMRLPGFGLHPLKGNREGQWSIAVSGNWRLTFQLEGGNVFNVNYEDYHR